MPAPATAPNSNRVEMASLKPIASGVELPSTGRPLVREIAQTTTTARLAAAATASHRPGRRAQRTARRWPGVRRARAAASGAQEGRLTIRYERRQDIPEAFLSLGCSLVCCNAIARYC